MSVPTSDLFHKWFTEHSLHPRPCSRSWASIEHEENKSLTSENLVEKIGARQTVTMVAREVPTKCCEEFKGHR